MITPPSIDSLLNGLRDSSPEVRQDASRKLRDLREEHDALPELLIAVNDPDMDVRLAVVETLSNFKCEAAEEALQKALFDEEWEIKWAALRSLGNQWNELDLRKMGDKLIEKRIAGVEALAKKRSSRYLRPLLSGLDEEEEVQAASIRALSDLGDPRAIGALKELQSEPSTTDELRAFIEETLIRLGDPETIRKKREGTLFSLQCDACQQKLPFSALHKVGSWRNESKWLCQFHFEQHMEESSPFEGKLKMCKVSKEYWPKVALHEGMSPHVRRKRYFSFPPAPKGQFRCSFSHKLRYERDRSPVGTELQPLSHRSAYTLAQRSANSPFLTSEAILFLKNAFERGYLLCDRCRTFYPVQKIEHGEDYRDSCICETCAKRMK